MDVTETVAVEEEGPRVEGPGRELREAREGLQLDLITVASQLHLSVSKLKALEEDDYEHLPGPVYVQGYLRNYASLLGLPVERILEAYRAQVPAEQKTPIFTGKGVRREVSSNHSVIRLVTVGIVLVLILLPLLWWRGYLHKSEQRVVTGAESLLTEITEGGGGEEGSLRSQAVAIPEAAPAAPSWEPQGAEAREEPPGIPTPEPDVAAARLADGTLMAADPSPQQQSSMSRMVIEMQGTSWVEVRDASGSARIKGLLHAGTIRRLVGNPPFEVVVGNTPAVTLTVNGEPFDLERYSRQNVAKFTLDPDAIDALR